MSLLEWLRASSDFPKFYWRPKEGGVERAAVGISSCGLRQYGGMAFLPKAPSKDGIWDSFPRNAFWFPKIEKEEPIVEEVVSVMPAEAKGNTFLPDSDLWSALIEQALRSIEQGRFQKVVLARRTTIYCHVDPYDLLSQLKGRSKGATLFCVQFSPESAFIGATPERLFRRLGRQVWVDAIAATAPVQQKGFSAKEKREFASVKHSIEKALIPLCKKWRWEREDSIYETATLQHLFNCFVGELNPQVKDTQLLAVLHPTAALGGIPRDEALDFIGKYEPFERGWYGSPLGFSSLEEAEFIVGIRSALIAQNALHLFSGAGIVQGSEAALEWDELDRKDSLIRELLAQLATVGSER